MRASRGYVVFLAVAAACAALALASPARAQRNEARTDEHRAWEASVGIEELGLVTWSDARLDVPVFGRLALVPQAALLHIAEPHSSYEEWHAYFGGGVGWDITDAWHVELLGLYGPRAYDIETIAAELEVEWDIGGDDDRHIPPTFELGADLTVNHVRWADGLGPAGPDVLQTFIQSEPVWRPTLRLELRPRFMLFFYDKPLDQAVGDQLGSELVLAEVGTFAPLVLGGASVGYAFVRWLTPHVQVGEIVYAGGVGSATEGLLGARARLTRGWTVLLGAGWLWNRVHGPLAASSIAESVPVGRAEISASF